MQWEKVITNPLGIAGVALLLVFRYLSKRHGPRWLVPFAYFLATVCIFGGFGLAYYRQSRSQIKPTAQTISSPSMQTDRINQKVDNGSAVAGVQGNVTTNTVAPSEQSKPKK